MKKVEELEGIIKSQQNSFFSGAPGSASRIQNEKNLSYPETKQRDQRLMNINSGKSLDIDPNTPLRKIQHSNGVSDS